MLIDDLSYALDALDILKESVRLASRGHTGFYRVAAAQLRLLLCDTTRRHGKIVDISLLPRLIPGLELPPLDHHSDVISITDEIPLANWLKQKIAFGERSEVTIRQLIRLVCDQDGGAHVDYKPESILRGTSNYPQIILSIAGVVLKAAEAKLKSNRQ
jgi:hypothetical protein